MITSESKYKANYPRVKLGDAFDLQMGKTPSRDNPKYWGGTNKWISIADIGRADREICSTKETISDLAVEESGIRSIPPNTLIMSFKLSIGKVAITTEKMFSNEAIMAFHNLGHYQFDLHFLYHQLSNKDWSVGINKAVMGATLNKASLKLHEVIVPPLPVQQAIAAELDKICLLKRNAEERLRKLDLLVKAKFTEMFGDGCPNVLMSDLCSIITDGTHQSPKFETQGIPFLFVSNIASNELTYETDKFISSETYEDLIKRTPIEKGDVLLSTVGSYGHPAVVKKNLKFLFQRHIAYLKPRRDKIDSLYLHSALLSPFCQEQIEKNAKGIAQKTLNLSEVKRMIVPLPPLPLQRTFAAYVEKVEGLKAVARKERDAVELLYRAKMQEHFSSAE